MAVRAIQFTRLDWAYFFDITEIQKAITQRPQKLSPLFLTYQQLIVQKIDTAKEIFRFSFVLAKI